MQEEAADTGCRDEKPEANSVRFEYESDLKEDNAKKFTFVWNTFSY